MRVVVSLHSVLPPESRKRRNDIIKIAVYLMVASIPVPPLSKLRIDFICYTTEL